MSPLMYFPYTGGIFYGKTLNTGKMAALEGRDLPARCNLDAADPGQPDTVFPRTVGRSDNGIDVPGPCRDMDSCQEDTAQGSIPGQSSDGKRCNRSCHALAWYYASQYVVRVDNDAYSAR